MATSRLARFAIKAPLFLVCLAPLGWLVWGAATHGLGANPIDAITDETGTWTLRFLVATLSITPLRRLTGWNGAIRFRRMLGLFAFFYGSLHFLTYIWLDQFFEVPEIVKDIAKRPFILVGFTAFTLMVPLALTSTAGWIRRLGGRRWNLLHRLIYLSAIAGVVHYWWLVKADVTRPLRYGVIVAVLLLGRLWWAWSRMRHAHAASSLPDRRVDSAPGPLGGSTGGR
jgi:methionine sulfoxide reductase heme-binding subunit